MVEMLLHKVRPSQPHRLATVTLYTICINMQSRHTKGKACRVILDRTGSTGIRDPSGDRRLQVPRPEARDRLANHHLRLGQISLDTSLKVGKLRLSCKYSRTQR